MNTITLKSAGLAGAVLLAGWLASAPAYGHAINGAIYTSTENHELVNANIYDKRQDVYLNGGPSNDPQCTGGKLDDDEYYFQVTNPNGTKLLSKTPIWARSFLVEGGVITEYTGTGPKLHNTGGTSPCGSLAVQLWPFDWTDNPGGVYKVWITRVSDFEAACLPAVDCGLDGFVHGHTKTDNFKVKRNGPEPPPQVGDLVAIKFYDANADGEWDEESEPAIEGWPMRLTSASQAVDSERSTDADGEALFDNLLPACDYFVEEAMPLTGVWVHSASQFTDDQGEAHDGSPVNPAGPTCVAVNETTVVVFGNYCEVPSGGRTPGFWSNQNGQAEIAETFGDIDAPAFLGFLAALPLVDADGNDFDPASYHEFRSWLLGGNAVNMSYMLSVHLAAMALNIEVGLVDPGAYYVPYGGTIGELVAEATAALAANPYAPSDHPQRGYLESLKNHLNALNENAGVLSPEPCEFEEFGFPSDENSEDPEE